MVEINNLISDEDKKQWFLTWLDQLDEEIKFWNSHIKSGGLDWALNIKNMLIQNLPHPSLIPFIKQSDQVSFKILDVGSGPMTSIGHKMEGKIMEITACDPLANAYNDILEKHHILPPVKTIFADGEHLSLFFPKDYFDIIICRNALDHSYNPLQIILQMIFLLKKNGLISLTHHKNEGENAGYQGLHRWNILRDKNDRNDMIIWNKKYKFSIQETFKEYAKITTTSSDDDSWVFCEIIKIKDFDKNLLTTDLHHKYNLMMNKIIRGIMMNQTIKKDEPKNILTKFKRLITNQI